MNTPQELWEGNQRFDQHGKERYSGEDTSGGDFALLSEQRQGGHRNRSFGQLTDNDEDGDTGVESSQIPELGLTDYIEMSEEDSFPAANLDQSHALLDLLDHIHVFVTETSEHGSRGSEEERDD
jgi:hypothetical protein